MCRAVSCCLTPRLPIDLASPRNHDPLAQDWSGINIYLEHLSKRCHQDVLLCYCNAVLKGRSDLKSFTFDWSSRSGKGPFGS